MNADTHNVCLSVIIPAFDEEAAIEAVLRHLQQVLDQTSWSYEIIVVDDGSQDSTGAQAENVAGVLVLRHRTNKGYGAAIKTGLRQARHPLICITDADGTYPNERIPDLVAALVEHGYDMVTAARTGSHVAIPLERRPTKWALARYAEFVAGEPIPDLNSGLRLFRRDLALRYENMLPDGFSFTTTITLAMLTGGYAVGYVPIDYHPRVGRSKIKPVQDTLNFVQLIFRMGLYFAPLKVFLPLSGILMTVALVWGVYTRLAWGNLADASMLAIVMAAVQVAAVGLLAELINHRISSNNRNR